MGTKMLALGIFQVMALFGRLITAFLGEATAMPPPLGVSYGPAPPQPLRASFQKIHDVGRHSLFKILLNLIQQQLEFEAIGLNEARPRLVKNWV